MMEQPDMFDLARSRILRDEAFKQNEDGAGEWKGAALTAFIQFANARSNVNQRDLFGGTPGTTRFITEDFRQWWMNRPNYREPRHPNAWGAFTVALAKAKLIHATGYVRPSASIKSHARKMLEWEINQASAS